MSDELVGTMMDAGMTPQDVREAFGEAYATEHDPGAPIEPVVQTLLTVARDNRQPPAPQTPVPSGIVNSLPDSKGATAVRVDTEDTYRDFRRGGNGVDMQALDAPENSESIPDVLNQLAQAEAGLSDSVDFQRGYASQWITGGGKRRHHKHTRVGDVMTRGAASINARFHDPALSPDQTCVLCGAPSDRAAVCLGCAMRPSVVGFGERGSAASLYDPNPTSRYVHATTLGADFYRLQHQLDEVLGGGGDFYRLQHQLEEVLGADAAEFYRLQHQLDESATVLGDDFYRLKWQTEEKAALLGNDGFYRLKWQTGENPLLGAMYDMPRFGNEAKALLGDDSFYTLDRFVDEAGALTSPSAAPAESIPLSFSQPDAYQHVATWKQGDNLYASMRIVGWDGLPRVLTATTPYSREVATVVGYAAKAGLSPSQTLAAVDPLARTLGASKLIPQLAAASPGVLRAVHGKITPLVMATMPVTNHRVGR